MSVPAVFSVLLGLLLVGCVTANTTSTVSSADIPANKYRKIVVFVENTDDLERLPAEELVVVALQSAGTTAATSLEVFNYHRAISDDNKATIILARGYDAALYVTVTQKAMLAESSRNVFTVVTKSELQDIRSAKLVWFGETFASASTNVATMRTVFGQAAKQLVAKMQADGAI
jgi:hypothetical protein